MLKSIWNIIKSIIFGAGEDFIDSHLVKEVEQEIRDLKDVREKSNVSYHELKGKIEFVKIHELPDLKSLLEDYKNHAKSLKSRDPNSPELQDIATLAVSVSQEIEIKTEELQAYEQVVDELQSDISELNSQISSLESDLNLEKSRAKITKTKAAIASTVRSDLSNAKSKLKQIKEKNIISSSVSESKLKKDVNYQMKKSSSNDSVTNFLNGL